MSTVASIKRQLAELARPADAVGMQRFFKTGPGEYGEGDVFLGIRVPVLRNVAKASLGLPTDDVPRLLASKIHEHRAVALMIWVMQFDRGDDKLRRRIYDLYLANTRWINNWDLVDLSTVGIVGRWLIGRSHAPLIRLAKSKLMWERRIAVVATFAFIRRREHATTLELVRMLMDDDHDLMHKACGWMLREVYKRDAKLCLHFLDQVAGNLPRTTLRYAIERCDEATRRRLMLVR